MKKEDNKPFIFDELRKMWLLLTEEEWVRQNFVQYLVQILHYPKANIALEKEIFIGEVKKRFDILVYDASYNPWMLVECKAPQVPLSEEVLQQVLRYHVSIPCQYLVITNGETTLAWKKQENSLKMIIQFPTYTKQGH